MQWAKPRASKSHRNPHRGHRTKIDFAEAETSNVGAQSVSEDNIPEILAQNPESPQGSGSRNSGTAEDLHGTESERTQQPPQAEDESSAWNYYSQQWDRLIAHHSEIPMFGKLTNVFGQGRQPENTEGWSTRSGNTDPTSVVNLSSDRESDTSNPATNWRVYILPALVLTVLVVLGVMTLFG